MNVIWISPKRDMSLVHENKWEVVKQKSNGMTFVQGTNPLDKRLGIWWDYRKNFRRVK